MAEGPDDEKGSSEVVSAQLSRASTGLGICGLWEADVSETQQTRSDFIAASTLFQQLHDGAPSGHFTLEWLMTSLRDQSYGAIILLLGIAAAAPGISLFAGFLLLAPAFQMIAGWPSPIFPQWVARQLLPTDKLSTVLKRAIPILKVLETAVRPRWPMPLGATRRIVGLMILLLTVRLLTNPLPASNLLPAALISFISLAYLEADGLMLSIGLFAGLIALAVDAKILFDVAHEIVDRVGFQPAGLQTIVSRSSEAGKQYPDVAALCGPLHCLLA